jgi:hypothetical protein
MLHFKQWSNIESKLINQLISILAMEVLKYTYLILFYSGLNHLSKSICVLMILLFGLVN